MECDAGSNQSVGVSYIMAKRIVARQMTFEVYKITHKESGKSYIGCTTKGIDERFKTHMWMAAWRPAGYLHHALRKYGADAFSLDLIASHENAEDMLSCEIAMIAKFGTLAPHGYNMTSGGEGGFMPCEEIRRKISEAGRRRIASDETRAKMSMTMSGRQLSDSHKESLSKGRIGMKFSDSHVAALSKAKKGRVSPNKGRKMSDEQKEKLRQAALLQWSCPDAIKRISEIRKGRKTSDATKKIIGAQSKARWLDEEYKKRLSESQKIAQQKNACERSAKMRDKWADPEFKAMMIAARQKSAVERPRQD